jgi:hypothetical protein
MSQFGVEDNERGDEVQTTLSTASMNGNSEYEAWSYVWGDTTSTKPIKLDK